MNVMNKRQREKKRGGGAGKGRGGAKVGYKKQRAIPVASKHHRDPPVQYSTRSRFCWPKNKKKKNTKPKTKKRKKKVENEESIDDRYGHVGDGDAGLYHRGASVRPRKRQQRNGLHGRRYQISSGTGQGLRPSCSSQVTTTTFPLIDANVTIS